MTPGNHIIDDLVETIKVDVINSMQSNNRVAGGNTVSQLEVVTTDTGAQLEAPFWIDALEYGRQPTSPNAPAGDPTLLERIQQWCSDKGIDTKAAYAITKKIHKYGYTGTPGVLTVPLGDDNVNMRLDEAMNELADNEANNFLELIGL